MPSLNHGQRQRSKSNHGHHVEINAFLSGQFITKMGCFSQSHSEVRRPFTLPGAKKWLNDFGFFQNDRLLARDLSLLLLSGSCGFCVFPAGLSPKMCCLLVHTFTFCFFVFDFSWAGQDKEKTSAIQVGPD